MNSEHIEFRCINEYGHLWSVKRTFDEAKSAMRSDPVSICKIDKVTIQNEDVTECEKNPDSILETAFRKCLADKFWIGAGLRKLTLDSEAVTEAMNHYIKQARDGWEDRGITRHEK